MVAYREMMREDVAQAATLHADYYNEHEGGEWTIPRAIRRINQVLLSMDSYCLVAEEGNELIGYAIGRFEQYDDLMAYDLVEIVISATHQNKGAGTAFMSELERRVMAEGAAMVQLQAVNDEMHAHFYGKLGYKDATNLVLKSKFL